jgi:uncharacterized protein
MSLQDRLMADLKVAMREGDVTRREAIRMLRAAILNEEVELQRREFEARGAGGETDEAAAAAVPRRSLSDEQIVQAVERLVKRHQDSIAEFRKGGRADLIAREEGQLAVIAGYLPYRLYTRDEIEAAVRAAIAETGASGPRDLGKLMPRLATELRGKADLNQVRQVAQDLLAG